MLSKIKFEKRKHPNNRRKHESIEGDTLTKTKGRKFETNRICKQFPIGHQKEIHHKRFRYAGSSVGTGTLSFAFMEAN